MFMAPLFSGACSEAPEAPPSGSYNPGIVSRSDVERAMAMHRPPAPASVVTPGPVEAPAPVVAAPAATKEPAPPPPSKPLRPRAARTAAAPVAKSAVPPPAIEPTPVPTDVVADASTMPLTPLVPSAPAAAPIVPPVAEDLDEPSPIYSKDDPDVRPAQLLTTQGTAGFSATVSDVNTMELVISKMGRVEQVKLSAPPKRMTDMLLLSGAKMWKFVPAMKDGQPVRYRTEVSWETTR